MGVEFEKPGLAWSGKCWPSLTKDKINKWQNGLGEGLQSQQLIGLQGQRHEGWNRGLKRKGGLRKTEKE